MSLSRILALFALGLSFPVLANDDETLRAAGIVADGPGLLTWFRQRTPNQADRRIIEEQIRNLASRSFPVRERAFEALRKRGVPAIPYLKTALTSSDLEVARRAERCLAKTERVP